MLIFVRFITESLRFISVVSFVEGTRFKICIFILLRNYCLKVLGPESGLESGLELEIIMIKSLFAHAIV